MRAGARSAARGVGGSAGLLGMFVLCRAGRLGALVLGSGLGVQSGGGETVVVCRGLCFGVRSVAGAWVGIEPSAAPRRQDNALPLMADPRWERDTLFVVAEQDFRFTEADVQGPPGESEPPAPPPAKGKRRAQPPEPEHGKQVPEVTARPLSTPSAQPPFFSPSDQRLPPAPLDSRGFRLPRRKRPG